MLRCHAGAFFFNTHVGSSVKKMQRGPCATCSLRWFQEWRSCGKNAHHRAGSRLASSGLCSRCSASTSLRSGRGPSTLAVPWRGSDSASSGWYATCWGPFSRWGRVGSANEPLTPSSPKGALSPFACSDVKLADVGTPQQCRLCGAWSRCAPAGPHPLAVRGPARQPGRDLSRQCSRRAQESGASLGQGSRTCRLR